MALGRATAVAPAPKVRFFVGDRQIFAKNTALQFGPGDQLELFGRRYQVLNTAPVFNLEDESTTVDVTLSDALLNTTVPAVEEI